MNDQDVLVKHGRRSRQQIMQLLQDFSTAGKSIVAFCGERQIAVGSFQNWRRKYRQDFHLPVNTQSHFSEVVISQMPSASLFAEVSGIRIYQAVSADFLKALR